MRVYLIQLYRLVVTDFHSNEACTSNAYFCVYSISVVAQWQVYQSFSSSNKVST